MDLNKFTEKAQEGLQEAQKLAGEIRENSRVVVDLEGDQLVFRSEPLQHQFKEAA